MGTIVILAIAAPLVVVVALIVDNWLHARWQRQWESEPLPQPPEPPGQLDRWDRGWDDEREEW